MQVALPPAVEQLCPFLRIEVSQQRPVLSFYALGVLLVVSELAVEDPHVQIVQYLR